MRFSTFVDRKTNKARKELAVIKDVLDEAGIKVKDFIKEHEPFLYVPSTDKGLDFGGVRVYKIGSSVAYRIQNESDTQPYGMSYPLDVGGMFDELLGDMDEEEAAEEVKKAIAEEFRGFFKKSSEAQEKANSDGFDPQSRIVVGGKVGDISNMM